MERKLEFTLDGSSTFYLPKHNERYHSTHGAVLESFHVFIQNGFALFRKNKAVSILEIGYGTGLNAFVTFLEGMKGKQMINYSALEKYPINEEEHQKLNHVSVLKAQQYKKYYEAFFKAPWEGVSEISDFFKLEKKNSDLLFFDSNKSFDLIYFDAFSPRVQPELWQEAVFKNLYKLTKEGGLLVTYSSKGDVRRILQSAGFKVVKQPGPSGKKEMVQAWKNPKV